MRKYKLDKRLEKSYESYLKKRKAFEDKGYALADKSSRRQYESDYYDAKAAGMSNNFARQMAYDDLRVTQSQSREIYRSMNVDIRNKYNINSFRELRGAPNVHDIITSMFEAGLIADRGDFEKSLGY